MEESVFKERVARLRKVNGVVSGLDPVLRSEAFELLKPYITGSPEPSRSAGIKVASASAKPRKTTSAKKTSRSAPNFGPPAAEPTDDEDTLIEKHLSDADHENAMLALALFYKRHGRGPFALTYVDAIARQHHLNMPKRQDKFFGGAKRGEPKVAVVRRQAEGWKITPSGETWLKATYGVLMGRNPLPVAET
jgi:hypothetical protein